MHVQISCSSGLVVFEIDFRKRTEYRPVEHSDIAFSDIHLAGVKFDDFDVRYITQNDNLVFGGYFYRYQMVFSSCDNAFTRNTLPFILT